LCYYFFFFGKSEDAWSGILYFPLIIVNFSRFYLSFISFSGTEEVRQHLFLGDSPLGTLTLYPFTHAQRTFPGTDVTSAPVGELAPDTT
jgi:hypothetical protein